MTKRSIFKKVFRVVVTCTIVLPVLKYLFPPAEIVGDSMYPSYVPGQLIFGTRVFLFNNIKKNDVLSYRSFEEDRIVIKRVFEVNRDDNGDVVSLIMLGDNPSVSYDSRYHGAVSVDRLVCKYFNPVPFDSVYVPVVKGGCHG